MQRATEKLGARALMLSIAGVSGVIGHSAYGAVVSWAGTNRVLSTASYWTGGNPPGSGDEAYFGTLELSGGAPESLGFKGTGTTPTVINLTWASVVFDDSAISSTGPLYIDSSLSSTNTGAASLTLNGDGVPTDDIIQLTNNVTGLVDFRGADATSGSPLTLTPAAGQMDVVNSTATLEIQALVAGSSGVTKVGAGTLYLYNAAGSNPVVSTYTGGLTINAGVAAFNNGNALGNANNTTTINNGTLEYLPVTAGSTGSLVATRSIALNSASSAIDISPGNTLIILGPINGGGALNKTDSGTLSITGTASYSGATNVQNGTLLVNGSIGNGTVTVASSAVLGGNGSIGGTVNVNSGGLLDPGFAAETAGTLTAGGLGLVGGSVLDLNMNDPINGNAFLDITGGVSITGGGIDLNQAGGTTPFSTDGTYELIGYGSFSGDPTTMQVLDPVAGQTYTFFNSTATDTIDLTIAPVPEPASVSLLAIVSLGACRRRRRAAR
jgi:fibronectin-binding autotransporter adhesin